MPLNPTPPEDPMLPTRFAVRGTRRETHDTFTLELGRADCADGFSFAPGQFNMLYAFGVGESPISISGDPSDPSTLVHTVRAVGPVTSAMQRLKEGDELGVRGPYGTRWPVDDSTGVDVVVVAGGIGLAPLRPAVYHLLSHRDKYGKVFLLYGARTPEDLLYAEELERWRSRFDFDVHVTVDRAADGWNGNVGVVTALISKANFDPEKAVAMVCGPEAMMRFTVQELQKRGLGQEHIFLSMERNMKCGMGFCGHCQLGPAFICRDGPVFRYDRIAPWFGRREV